MPTQKTHKHHKGKHVHKTLKKHLLDIEKSKKSKKFKEKSNKIYTRMLKENSVLCDVIIPTLESKKSKAYKSGYLAGITTIYDLLRRQSKKDSFRFRIRK